MGKYRFVVFTNPVEGREDEFNEWYDNQHVPDVLNVPGFVAAQRFKLSSDQRMSTDIPWGYLAIYEVETDDLKKTLDTLAERVGTPAIPMSDALAPERLSYMFEELGDRVDGAS